MSHHTFTPKTSYQEDRFLFFWKKHGIPYPLIRQYEIVHYAGGFSYFADYAHLESRTLIEIDGSDYHTSQAQKQRDQQRQKQLERWGWSVIRFTGREIYRDPVRTIYRATRAIEKNAYNLRAS